MSTKLLPEPERWADRSTGHVEPSAEDAVGAVFNQIRAATEPSSAAVARWARIAMSPSPRPVGPRLLAAALAGTLLVVGGAAAGFAWHASITKARERARNAPEAGEPARTPHVGRRRAIASPSDLPSPPELAPAPESLRPEPAANTAETPAVPPRAPAPFPSAPSARETARPSARVVASATSAGGVRAATVPPPLETASADDEAQIVARAFRQLRTEHDATAAIASLDEHDRRFGVGALNAEAAIARVEALLLLGRTDEALPALLAIRGTPVGRTPEVRAARAELLARAGRCAEAKADVDALLAAGAPAATRQRALRARASCARSP